LVETTDYNWHATTGLLVCAYSSTANGYFATGGVKGAKGWTNPTTLARLRVGQRLASELGVSVNQIALAYLLHLPFPVVPLLGTANVEHLADALAAERLALSADQVRELRDAGGDVV
jgi:aryl-alcohol dehydrogenase-like predicted oxidoreductase